VAVNVADLIQKVRAVEADIERQEQELHQKLEKHRTFAEWGRAELLKFLNDSGQKALSTPFGGAHWKPKVTWRVADKDAFLRHVVGTEDWALTTWAATPSTCATFLDEHKMTPPGVERSVVNVLYVTAPPKPKSTKVETDNSGE
jgi:hypothetical protein